MTRIVLDARAAAHLTHHLEVVCGAHPQALRLEQLALPLEFGKAIREFCLDICDGSRHALRSGDIVRGREDVDLLILRDNLARHRMQRHQTLDLITKHLDPHRVRLVYRKDLERIPANPEGATLKTRVVTGVLDVNEPAQERVAIVLLTHSESEHAVDVLLRCPQAVDRRYRGHHDDIPPSEQRIGRGVAQTLDLLVDGGVLLDIGVRLRDICLWLVVVVVGHEVLDRIVGQQLAELVGELGRERLVGRHDQRRPLHPLDEPCCRGALAGAGGSQEHDVALPCLDALHQVLDGLRLISGRRVVRDHLDGCHGAHEIGDGAHRVSLGVRCRPLLPEAVHLDFQGGKVARVVDDDIRNREALLTRRLGRYAAPCVVHVQTPLHEARQARVVRAVHDDDPIPPRERRRALLREERHVINDDGVGRCPCKEVCTALGNPRMRDGVEPGQSIGIREHDLGQARPIQASIGIDNAGTE